MVSRHLVKVCKTFKYTVKMILFPILHNPYQKQKKAVQRLHKHYTSCAHSSATFKLFNTPVHSDHKVKNL